VTSCCCWPAAAIHWVLLQLLLPLCLALQLLLPLLLPLLPLLMHLCSWAKADVLSWCCSQCPAEGMLVRCLRMCTPLQWVAGGAGMLQAWQAAAPCRRTDQQCWDWQQLGLAAAVPCSIERWGHGQLQVIRRGVVAADPCLGCSHDCLAAAACTA
jgi:hypothetical protein